MNIKHKNLSWYKKEKITGSPVPNFVYDRNNPNVKPEGTLNRPLMELLENDVHLDDEIERIVSELATSDHHRRYYTKQELNSSDEKKLIHWNCVYSDNQDPVFKEAKRITLFEKPLCIYLPRNQTIHPGADNSQTTDDSLVKLDLSFLKNTDNLLCQFVLDMSSSHHNYIVNGFSVASLGGKIYDCFGKYPWQTGRTYHVGMYGIGFFILKAGDSIGGGARMLVHGFVG